jgi:hypothetical protein
MPLDLDRSLGGHGKSRSIQIKGCSMESLGMKTLQVLVCNNTLYCYLQVVGDPVIQQGNN